MREPKFDVGDVVRIVDMEFTRDVFDKLYGKMARVEEVTIRANSNSYWIRTDDGAAGYINEELLEGVPLEEVQRCYADKPRRGFIVDGLTVDELESGQDEAYEMFQRAAKDAEYCERVQKETKEAYKRIRRCKLYRKESDAWDCIVGFAFTTLGEIATWIILWLKGYLDWSFSLAGMVLAALMAVYAAHHMVWLIKGINSEIVRIDSEHDGIT